MADTRDIWIFDLQREAASRVTFEPSDDTGAVWSPDGRKIAYSSDRGARDIYIKNASGIGAEELVIESKIPKNVEAWSPDGLWMAFKRSNSQLPQRAGCAPLDTREPLDFRRTQLHEGAGRFSTDGKWLAYESEGAGRTEVFVQPVPRLTRHGRFRATMAGSHNGAEMAENCPTPRSRLGRG